VNSTRFRHGFVYLLIILAVAVIILGAFARQDSPTSLPISEVAQAIREGRVAEIVISDNDQIRLTMVNGNTAVSSKEPTGTATEQLMALGVSSEQLAANQDHPREGDQLAGHFDRVGLPAPAGDRAGRNLLHAAPGAGSNNQALSLARAARACSPATSQR
jgi:hypothetical protein